MARAQFATTRRTERGRLRRRPLRGCSHVEGGGEVGLNAGKRGAEDEDHEGHSVGHPSDLAPSVGLLAVGQEPLLEPIGDDFSVRGIRHRANV